MPFAIWCTTCPKPSIIGQGVRFNAEKKKVGNYHSTPIFSFRMKHVACGGSIEIRTDPKNTAYVVTEGAKKRDTGDDVIREGDMVIRSEEEREKIKNDAFAALEGRVEEKNQMVTDKSRIEDLYKNKEKDWNDPYAASKKLRKSFRIERKVWQQNEERTEDLRDRMSLGIELLDENEEDQRRAGIVDYGAVEGNTAVAKIQSRPLFASTTPSDQAVVERGKIPRAQRIAVEAEQKKRDFQVELGNNTRAALDPFLNIAKPHSTAPLLLKRRKATESIINQNSTTVEPPVLVDYDSE